jgi:serine O-acetyltransferase
MGRSPADMLNQAITTLKRDVEVARERDPAARSMLEVVTSYPGVHALWMHRVAHRLYRRGLRLPARWVSQVSRFATGIEIHPGARIGPGLFIDHGMGIVIGETTEIGEDVTIYQGVTLGGTGKEIGKRHPTVRDGAIIGTGAQILGSVEIGEGAKIGAGSIVIKDVPANSTVVGNPGRAVVVNGQRVDPEELHHPTLEHTRLPDPIAEAMACLVRRMSELEQDIADLRAGREPRDRRVDDGDCLPTAQEEIAGILGLNGGSGI